MKRLVFKKWVEVVLMVIEVVGLMMMAAFEWNSFMPYIIGMSLLIVPALLEVAYGRN